MEYLFVYGTLRRFYNHPLQKLIRRYTYFLGKATMQGRLYDIGRYPAVVYSENPADQVTGEVYALKSTQPLVSQLDIYEGCCEKYPQPWEYHRIKVPVSLSGGKNVEAWVYVYNWSLRGKRWLRSGDYCDKSRSWTSMS